MVNRRRSYARSPKRLTDWSGVISDPTVAGAGVVTSTNLWTPVTEMEHATVTRIRGTINPVMQNELEDAGSGFHSMEVFAGIQVVNRAQGAVGVARDPGINDDMEGGEWLWLRSWLFAWEVDSGAPPAWIVPAGGDVLTGAYDPYVDVKAQRKIDLSQDELLFTLSAIGSTANFVAKVHIALRVLMKF